MLAGVAGVAGVPLGSRRKKNTDLRMFWSFYKYLCSKETEIDKTDF